MIFSWRNALSELKDVKELHPFADTNPYKNAHRTARKNLKSILRITNFQTNREMSIKELVLTNTLK